MSELKLRPPVPSIVTANLGRGIRDLNLFTVGDPPQGKPVTLETSKNCAIERYSGFCEL